MRVKKQRLKADEAEAKQAAEAAAFTKEMENLEVALRSQYGEIYDPDICGPVPQAKEGHSCGVGKTFPLALVPKPAANLGEDEIPPRKAPVNLSVDDVVEAVLPPKDKTTMFEGF